MRSTINVCNCGECVFVFFLLFLVSTGSGLFVCSFAVSFSTLSLVLWSDSFPGIILDTCE